MKKPKIIKIDSPKNFNEELENSIMAYRQMMIEEASKIYGVSIEEMTKVADSISDNTELPDGWEFIESIHEKAQMPIFNISGNELK
jgi:hypothetical protein